MLHAENQNLVAKNLPSSMHFGCLESVLSAHTRYAAGGMAWAMLLLCTRMGDTYDDDDDELHKYCGLCFAG